jgi:hypothetical protein
MPGRARKPLLLAVAIFLTSVGAAGAVPIPENPIDSGAEQFVGSAAVPRAVRAKLPPRHPFMAPNGRSNLHNDAYQSDVYRRAGPLGRRMSRTSTFLAHECASVTFDSRGRIVTICVGLERPFLAVMEPRTLEILDQMDLPPRTPGGGAFTDFSGGGYFYLDHRDRAVLPTTSRHLYVVQVTDAGELELSRDYDLSTAVPSGDSIISALPDWDGLLWFASKRGIVGTLDFRSGRIRTLDTKEPNGNSFAVDDSGGVFIVTDEALYRFDATRRGRPKVNWRRQYHNTGEIKPGQTQAGSGTTPTLLGRRWVAITDNADPMNILVLNRRRGVKRRLVCEIAVFRKGAGNTDQSLIGVNRSLIVENNYGYSGPASTEQGGVTEPGLERVRIDRDGRGCRRLWRSHERAPSVVPKLSLRAGLVYTYTKPPREDGIDAWYLTAIDYRSGRTVYKRLAGTGLGYNNNYAPVTIGPDGTAYVGVLGGLVALRDRR